MFRSTLLGLVLVCAVLHARCQQSFVELPFGDERQARREFESHQPGQFSGSRPTEGTNQIFQPLHVGRPQQQPPRGDFRHTPVAHQREQVFDFQQPTRRQPQPQSRNSLSEQDVAALNVVQQPQQPVHKSFSTFFAIEEPTLTAAEGFESTRKPQAQLSVAQQARTSFFEHAQKSQIAQFPQASQPPRSAQHQPQASRFVAEHQTQNQPQLRPQASRFVAEQQTQNQPQFRPQTSRFEAQQQTQNQPQASRFQPQQQQTQNQPQPRPQMSRFVVQQHEPQPSRFASPQQHSQFRINEQPSSEDQKSFLPPRGHKFQSNPNSNIANDYEEMIFREQAANAKYSFTSQIDDSINGNQHEREEERDGLAVKGKYSYSDGYVKRTVFYEADENGYRVVKEEEEPLGNGPQIDPNGHADVRSFVAGNALQYSITAADIQDPHKNLSPEPQQQPQRSFRNFST
ncbi:hypothetical protein FQA39_LY16366 [Lamprigera yunnana]|nr:hypothetical protein FQA39_LY16366 [Lamprigera yunnana]